MVKILVSIIIFLIIAVSHTIATQASRPLLHEAITKENLDLLRQLLSAPDVDVNIRDQQKASPLHFAVLTGLEYVKLLLDHPAINVNARDKHKLSPLHYAMIKPKDWSKDVALALLEHGANIEAVGSDQKVTPLHLAVMENNLDMVRLLIDHGAKLNVKSVSGKTVLDGAVLTKNPELVRLLLTSKSFTFADFTHHHELLANALPFPEVLRAFLQAGFDATARDTQFNSTLLHLAATLGSLESVKVLLEFNADMNARDGWLKTPLHYAVYNKQNHIAHYLWDRGAKHALQDDAGITPLDEAVQVNNEEMIELLRSLGSEEDKIEL